MDSIINGILYILNFLKNPDIQSDPNNYQQFKDILNKLQTFFISIFKSIHYNIGSSLQQQNIQNGGSRKNYKEIFIYLLLIFIIIYFLLKLKK